MTTTYTALGLMSGTSLDGLDMALCKFMLKNGSWSYVIEKAETRPYSEAWKQSLGELHTATAAGFVKTDIDYGRWMGEQCRHFLHDVEQKPMLIASHGHTIFHQPELGITSQIGSGPALAAAAGITTVCDFRSLDVASGGQGAPLVPVGDALLFAGYTACINIGGFANISYDYHGTRKAFDICAANFVLNRLAERTGAAMDRDGAMAGSASVDPQLLHHLNAIPYYSLLAPKSLGREWAENTILPLLPHDDAATAGLLCTYTEHIAMQVAAAIPSKPNSRVLITGGGAHNGFLVERIRAHSKGEVVIADGLTTDFKEALIFALLGILRLRQEPNCMMSVTGASTSSCSGAVHYIQQ